MIFRVEDVKEALENGLGDARLYEFVRAKGITPMRVYLQLDRETLDLPRDYVFMDVTAQDMLANRVYEIIHKMWLEDHRGD